MVLESEIDNKLVFKAASLINHYILHVCKYIQCKCTTSQRTANEFVNKRANDELPVSLG